MAEHANLESLFSDIADELRRKGCKSDETGIFKRSQQIDHSIYRMCYGEGKYVATTFSVDTIIYSEDGISWKDGVISSRNAHWHHICYGNGMFVAIGKREYTEYIDGELVTKIEVVTAYSYDGISWGSSRCVSSYDTSTSLNACFPVCYGNGKFVTFGAHSEDGLTWTKEWPPSQSSNNEFICNDICFGNNKFVVLGNHEYESESYDTVLYISDDGINWTSIGEAELPYKCSTNYGSICFDGSRFILECGRVNTYDEDGNTEFDNQKFLTSQDGQVWEVVNANLYIPLGGSLYFYKDRFIITSPITYFNSEEIGDTSNYCNIAYSYDCITWTPDTSLSQVGIQYDIYTPRLCIGESGFIAYNFGISSIDEYVYCGGYKFIADKTVEYMTSLPSVLIRNDQNVIPTGDYTNRYDKTYGVKVGYCSNGDIMISMSGNNGILYPTRPPEYETYKLKFSLEKAPDGVKISYYGELASALDSSCGDCVTTTCVVSGLTVPSELSISMNSYDSEEDCYTCAITITAIL